MSGSPRIAYRDAGGVRESILDGVTGLLAADEADLIAQVDRLLSDDALRHGLGAKARVRPAVHLGRDRRHRAPGPLPRQLTQRSRRPRGRYAAVQLGEADPAGSARSRRARARSGR